MLLLVYLRYSVAYQIFGGSESSRGPVWILHERDKLRGQRHSHTDRCSYSYPYYTRTTQGSMYS